VNKNRGKKINPSDFKRRIRTMFRNKNETWGWALDFGQWSTTLDHLLPYFFFFRKLILFIL